MNPPKKVLVVDDADDNRELYAEYLSFKGFEVATAATGSDALAKVADGRFDAIVLDLTLPDMDGWEVTRMLKSSPSTERIPVIVVSGHSGGEETAASLGCSGYLSKPCLPDVLLSAIEKSLT